jgi:hypothetical protein
MEKISELVDSDSLHVLERGREGGRGRVEERGLTISVTVDQELGSRELSAHRRRVARNLNRQGRVSHPTGLGSRHGIQRRRWNSVIGDPRGLFADKPAFVDSEIADSGVLIVEYNLALNNFYPMGPKERTIDDKALILTAFATIIEFIFFMETSNDWSKGCQCLPCGR